MTSDHPLPDPLDPGVDPPLDLPGLAMPDQFYSVATTPAPLAGMTLPPRETPWDSLHEIGFRQ